MRMKSLLIGAVALAAAAGIFAGRAIPPALADRGCPADPNAADAARGVVAIADGRVLADSSTVPTLAGGAPGSMLRHVASSDAGVAYVRDRVGADDLVIASGGTTTVLPQGGEASHPAWSPTGALVWGLDDRLVLRSAAGVVRSVAGPVPGGAMEAPLFDSDTIVAVVSAAPTRAVPEDAWSDDLWRYVPQRGSWTRLTTFPAGTDRWTAVRTPMVAPDGSIEFVVVSGRGSQLGLPHFALWQLHGDHAHLVEPLDGERYLAGYAPTGERLWNVPDRAAAMWLITRDTPSGEMTVGCGAVAVDPMDAVDPDRTGHEQRPRATSAPATGEPADPVETALLVGDFTSDVAAGVIARQVARAYEGSVPVDVVHGGGGSNIVRPQHWAVIVRLPGNTDGSAELAALRAMLPQFARHSWIVVP